LLKQKRDGFKRVINENPQTLVFYRHPAKDDGFGGTIPDFTKSPTEHVNKVRMSHPGRENGPFDYEISSVGAVPPSGRFIQALWNADIAEGDRVDSYKVGSIDELVAFGGVFGKQAILISANDVEAS
jgi:hypothetical protein